MHRSFLQRIAHVALFSCQDCRHTESIPRFSYRLGDQCRCPRCGTNRLTKLKERDHIDRMEFGLWNILARIGGGKLYHCCFCRLQFYDRRRWEEVKEPTFAHQKPAKTA